MLRQISEFMPTGLQLENPGAFSFDPEHVIGIAVVPDKYIIRLHLRSGVEELRFYYMDDYRTQLYNVKRNIEAEMYLLKNRRQD